MPAIPSDHRVLENSERPPVRGARLRGPADPNEIVRLLFVVRRRPDAPPLPDHAHWMATPPGRRKFLSRPEFAAKFGAAAAELEKVATFARDRGLTVGETSIARRCVVASGSVETVNRAFGVTLNTYEARGETYRSHDGRAHLPAGIADLLDGVLGLDNRRLGRRASNGGPYGATPQTPLQVANFYGFPIPTGGPNSWKNATGQTIGILEILGGYDINDVNAYWNSLGISPLPTVIPYQGSFPYGGHASSPSNADFEVTMDIEISGAIAPGATIVVYFGSPNEIDWHNLVSTAVHDATHNPKVLSISWSDSEQVFGINNINMMRPVFLEALTMGITVFAASGDAGAGDAEGDQSPQVQYPAADPSVTGCGGTYISTDPNTQQKSQGTWNDAPNFQNPNQPSGATGGGVSALITDLGNFSWQSNVQINGQPLTGRGVPDVAGNASPFSGYDIGIYGSTLSQLGKLYSSPLYESGTVGGTSAVAPLYAGLLALINANLFPAFDSITSNTSVGFLNPTLYNLGGIQQSEGAPNRVFWDINDGGNNSFNGVTGYQTVAWWDPCTGWGSINGGALLEMILVGYVAANPGCMAAIRAFFGR